MAHIHTRIRIWVEIGYPLIQKRNKKPCVQRMLLATDCFLTHVITSYLPNLASSIIILVPQLISLFQPFYPFGDRLYAAKLIHSEYSKLALDAEKNINQYLYGSKNIQDFAKLAVSFQKSLSSVEEKYAPPDLFPRKKRLHKKSERNVTQYINTHFHAGG